MATQQGDGSIILTTAIDQSGLKNGMSSMAAGAKKMAGTTAKAFLAIGAAAATATIAIAKASVDAFAEYEQLVGGVETLFKGSSKKLLEYANEAYRTTGQSANEYMQNVTAFSASLLSAVGGDTEKAAEVANAAMISISDNVNKMGSSAESVQMAFQGFAKQQYMLLDNLKLGYGGTKTEMERLLKDAQAITGVKYDIDNLADVYTAIGVIQEKFGIAGTTAKEASTTISGSAATMKAAWQNVLTAISGGGDLDRAINNLVDSISIYFENIVPVVERALSGIGRLIEKVAPQLVQTVAKSLIAAIPSLLNAVYEMIIGLSKGIYQGIIDLFNGTSREVLTDQADNIQQSVKNQNDLTKAVEETNEAMEKTTASFDTVEILSTGAAQGTSEEPIIPEISGGGLGKSLEIEETEKKASALELIFEQISRTIKKVWDSEPVQAFWEAVKSYGAFLWGYLSTLGTNLWENLKTTWGNIEGDFDTMTSNMSGLWTAFWKDVQVGIDTWGQPIIDGVDGVFNSIWTTAVDPYIQLIVGAWSDFTGILKSKWEEYGQPLIDDIGQFATNAIGAFQSIYDNVLEPIITPFLQEMTSLWNNHFSKTVGKAFDFVSSLAILALIIYNKFIFPIVSWLSKKLKPAFSNIGKAVSSILGTVGKTISGVLGGIFDSLDGLLEFITGVFTGDWKKAWNGISQYFKGVWEGFGSLIKGVLNIIIDALNVMINGMNLISFNMPNWDWLPNNVQGKSFGINIPNIPKLAQGAVIPPNREFLAVLGDQKQGTNIEAPLQTIVDAFNIALSQNRGYGGGNTEVVLEIDGREFGRAVVEQGNRENRRIGTRLVIA